MKLYLIRHAIAMDYPEFNGDDSLRPLTNEGKKKFKISCQGFKKMDLSFDLILASPYVRAQETAAIIHEELNLRKPIITCPLLAPGHNSLQLEVELGKYDEESIAIVGHEPSISAHVACFSGGSTLTHIEMKKGSLACVEFAQKAKVGKGVLRFLLPPSVSRTIGGC